MKVFKPRSRMISVRLSQEEYDEICHLSALTGARSLSDLARDAMRLFLNYSLRDRSLADSSMLVQSQMEDLNRQIDELRKQLLSPEQHMTQRP
jgi:hypothetical protein